MLDGLAFVVLVSICRTRDVVAEYESVERPAGVLVSLTKVSLAVGIWLRMLFGSRAGSS